MQEDRAPAGHIGAQAPGRVPLVSLIIPCFNLAAHLPEAVNSALGQTHGSVQVVIVDDGSTDDTATIARGYGDRVLYQHQPNGGLSRARNAGLALAAGEFAVFLDADDVLEPDYVQRCLDVLQAAGPTGAFVYTQVQYFGLRHGVSSFPEFDPELLKSKNFVHASALLRTDVARRVPFCEELRLGWEDWDFFLGLVEHGYTGVLLDEPLLRYRQREGSMLADLRAEQKLHLRAQIIRRHLRSYGLLAYVHINLIRVRHGIGRRVRAFQARYLRRG